MAVGEKLRTRTQEATGMPEQTRQRVKRQSAKEKYTSSLAMALALSRISVRLTNEKSNWAGESRVGQTSAIPALALGVIRRSGQSRNQNSPDIFTRTSGQARSDRADVASASPDASYGIGCRHGGMADATATIVSWNGYCDGFHSSLCSATNRFAVKFAIPATLNL